MNIWKDSLALSESGTSFVMVTMTGVIGSAPQEVGTKMLVTKDGLFSGTVGGGKVELAAIKKAKEILEGPQSPPETVKWNLQKDIGMTCGGEVIFLFEHFHESPWPIVIFGAGHVAQAVTRILSTLSPNVTCIDSREEWVGKLEGVKKIHHPNPKELVATFSPKTYFLSMTMGHSFDVPILFEIFKHASDCPYVGVIGSDVKGIKIKKELKDLGVTPEFLEKLRVPMGLSIGNNQPNEIAISIAAELLQVRDSLG